MRYTPNVHEAIVLIIRERNCMRENMMNIPKLKPSIGSDPSLSMMYIRV